MGIDIGDIAFRHLKSVGKTLKGPLRSMESSHGETDHPEVGPVHHGWATFC